MSIVGADGTCAAVGGELWNNDRGEATWSPGVTLEVTGSLSSGRAAGMCRGGQGGGAAMKVREKNGRRENGWMMARGLGGILCGLRVSESSVAVV